MSTYTLLRRLQKEIEKVNEEIDLRIINGLSYKSLSKKHKVMMERLHALNRVASVSTRTKSIESSWSKGLMSRLAQYASVFLM
jgi:hypothetical protein